MKLCFLAMGHVLAILGFFKNLKEDLDHLFKTEQATIKKNREAKTYLIILYGLLLALKRKCLNKRYKNTTLKGGIFQNI